VKRYRLPARFVLDHVSRGLLRPSAVLRVTGRSVVLELTDAEAAELLSDARHYADQANGYAADYRGLVASAKATIRALTNNMIDHT